MSDETEAVMSDCLCSRVVAVIAVVTEVRVAPLFEN